MRAINGFARVQRKPYSKASPCKRISHRQLDNYNGQLYSPGNVQDRVTSRDRRRGRRTLDSSMVAAEIPKTVLEEGGRISDSTVDHRPAHDHPPPRQERESLSGDQTDHQLHQIAAARADGATAAAISAGACK